MSRGRVAPVGGRNRPDCSPVACFVRFQINNEYDRLDAVLVHRPGNEIERLTHDNMRRFLFEDVPFLRRMQEERERARARFARFMGGAAYSPD